MVFTFIGNKFANSPPIAPVGSAFLQNPNKDHNNTTFIDLGSFATRILKPNNDLIEIKNFFIDTPREAEASIIIDNKYFLYGQKAIDFAQENNISTKEIIKNKCFYYDSINTFEFIKYIFEEHVRTPNVIINEQEPVITQILSAFLKEKNITFVNNSLAHLNYLTPISNEDSGIILDIGYGSIDILFIYHGFIFEQYSHLKGIRSIQENTFGTTNFKDIDNSIRVLSSDSFQDLFQHLYKELITEVINTYYQKLNITNLSKLLDQKPYIYIAGGVLEEFNICQLTKGILQDFFNQKNIRINIQEVGNTHLSLVYGLADYRE